MKLIALMTVATLALGASGTPVPTPSRKIAAPPGTNPTDPAPTAAASTTSGTPPPASTAPTSLSPTASPSASPTPIR